MFGSWLQTKSLILVNVRIPARLAGLDYDRGPSILALVDLGPSTSAHVDLGPGIPSD